MKQNASPPVCEFRLECFLPFRLSVLSNRISQAVARVYQHQYGLSITQWRVLAVLGRFPGLAAREVAERTSMDKVAVSRAIASLLDRGLLARAWASDDKRRSKLALTPSGLAIHADVTRHALACEARLLAALDEPQREALSDLLDRLEGPGLAALEQP